MYSVTRIDTYLSLELGILFQKSFKGLNLMSDTL